MVIVQVISPDVINAALAVLQRIVFDSSADAITLVLSNFDNDLSWHLLDAGKTFHTLFIWHDDGIQCH